MKIIKEDQTGYRVVTRNVQAFAGIASKMFDPFFGEVWTDEQTGNLVMAIGFLRLVFVIIAGRGRVASL